MEITIKFFGMIAEKMKCEEASIKIAVSAIPDLKVFFGEMYPSLQNLEYKIAVNQTISNAVQDTSTVTEIALLPPFSGG